MEKNNTCPKPKPERDSLSKEELQCRVTQLEAHVAQLKNIIKKQHEDKTRTTPSKRKQREFDFTKCSKRHVLLKILYVGWDYHGFAVQDEIPKTIESALFDALNKTRLIENRETSNYHRCGRTDKGVSAFSQVISIDLRSNLSEGPGVIVPEGHNVSNKKGNGKEEIQYMKILNKVLPPEIRVLAWSPVEPDFSARFDCKERTYKYFFPRGDMDIEIMRVAGQKLVGTHDFRNLCKMDVGNGVVTFMRRIMSVNIEEEDPSPTRLDGYRMCTLTVVGQAFLWHQIRCIVAVLALIGQGKEKAEVVDELLDVENNPRKPQYTMALELPLNLYECQYEDVTWHYDHISHGDTLKHLQNLWATHAIKTTMIKNMLDDLAKVPVALKDGTELEPVTVKCQSDCLLPGNKPRTYQPLLTRHTCESLEERIEYYAKRRKLNTSSTPETIEDKT
ncbi:unnamed protein product [Owenia fusiformis]|uniref:Pseudouridine synthase I TruA alpha/beta domain-containing protein n=1 Tax=Owenia fusiformis TaxID=6347 RepID=A0A8J1UXE3_OWEFU|nr:unnamed protein product [Owenia fusiformis]